MQGYINGKYIETRYICKNCGECDMSPNNTGDYIKGYRCNICGMIAYPIRDQIMNNKTLSHLTCGECSIAKHNIRVVGNGISEPPYLHLERCPHDSEYYHYPDDACNHLEKLGIK